MHKFIILDMDWIHSLLFIISSDAGLWTLYSRLLFLGLLSISRFEAELSLTSGFIKWKPANSNTWHQRYHLQSSSKLDKKAPIRCEKANFHRFCQLIHACRDYNLLDWWSIEWFWSVTKANWHWSPVGESPGWLTCVMLQETTKWYRPLVPEDQSKGQ